MALTAGSNWGSYTSRFMATLPGMAAIVPVNQDTLAFEAGGYDPFNGGAVFAADKFYRIGSSTGEKAYKPSYKTIEAKDELDTVLKRKNVLQSAEVSLVFNQDPEGFLAKNMEQRFMLIYRESARDDDMIKYRVCPKTLFSISEITVPAGGDYVTYPVTALLESSPVDFELSYRILCDIYAQEHFVSSNSGDDLYWYPEFGSPFKLADIGPGGTPTYAAAADDAAAAVPEGTMAGFLLGKFVVQ